MEHILTFIKTHKKFLIPIAAISAFLLLRTILLQKPNTDLIYTVPVENLVDTVAVSGTYTTASQTQVLSPTNGVISQLYVANGDEVRKGDPLFHVESTATVDQQRSAYANYLTAQNTLSAAQAKLNSLQATLFKANQAFVNDRGVDNPTNDQKADPVYIEEQATWLQAEADYKNQQGVIAQAQAQVASTLLAYQETQSVTVVSPANGRIVNLLSTIGDQVMAQSPQTATTLTTITQPSVQPVLVIANLGDPYIKASISEAYAARIMQGQRVAIVFDALKNLTFHGIISDIATVGTTSQGIVTYDTRIQVSALPSRIKPNMTALITIETLRKDNVLTVPNSAIIAKNNSTYVIQAKTHKKLPVVLGTKGIAKTEIMKGLFEGIQIVANPNGDE
jgi:HlyD family secretion protein